MTRSSFPVRTVLYDKFVEAKEKLDELQIWPSQYTQIKIYVRSVALDISNVFEANHKGTSGYSNARGAKGRAGNAQIYSLLCWTRHFGGPAQQ